MTDNIDATQSKEEAEMIKYGVTRERMDYYHVAIFRYTSLKDAVAQARRCSSSVPE